MDVNSRSSSLERNSEDPVQQRIRMALHHTPRISRHHSDIQLSWERSPVCCSYCGDPAPWVRHQELRLLHLEGRSSWGFLQSAQRGCLNCKFLTAGIEFAYGKEDRVPPCDVEWSLRGHYTDHQSFRGDRHSLEFSRQSVHTLLLTHRLITHHHCPGVVDRKKAYLP